MKLKKRERTKENDAVVLRSIKSGMNSLDIAIEKGKVFAKLLASQGMKDASGKVLASVGKLEKEHRELAKMYSKAKRGG